MAVNATAPTPIVARPSAARTRRPGFVAGGIGASSLVGSVPYMVASQCALRGQPCRVDAGAFESTREPFEKKNQS